MTDIPREAIDAAAAAITGMAGEMSALEDIARECLEAAEAVWPHDAPKRDPASTASARTQISTTASNYHRFGFGPAHITS